jgi:nucleotide-binding universal stress UspA family protein
MKMKNSKKPAKSRRESATTPPPPNIQTILATTDFSDESRSGVRYAVALGEKLNAPVALLHVIEPLLRMSGVESVVLARDDSELTKFARKKLVAMAKREGKGGVAVTSSVRAGKPFHEINTAARESMADLIVIATHGYTGVEHVLLGSTAERVVRHAPCSVLTVPARIGKGPSFRLKKILVPMDFSDLSKDALPLATFLAAQFKAEVVLLHIVEKFPIGYLMGRELTSHAIVPLIKQAEADLERAAADLAKSIGVKISAAVREGRPHEEICEAAKALAADLIVLTTHGYTGLKHVWLGSTAERVVRHASCPVLIVRERDRTAPR